MRFPLVVAPELLDRPERQLNKEDLASHSQIVVKFTDEKSPDVSLLQQAPKWFVTDMSTKKSADPRRAWLGPFAGPHGGSRHRPRRAGRPTVDGRRDTTDLSD